MSHTGLVTESSLAFPAAPGCSIRLVAKRTGIAAGTLRAWERRYGFPKPERRPGGSRVYSERDIARLALVVRALDVGFRAGEVVPLSEADIAGLLRAARARPLQSTASRDADDVVARVLDALAADDIGTLSATLRAAATALGPRQFVTDVAHPLALRIGRAWESGEIEVRHEHLASACLTTQLRLLLAAHDLETAPGPRVLLTTLPGEPHVLPLDMVAVYLASWHAGPRLLGAETPPKQIAAAARGLSVDAVGISISAAAERPKVRAHVRELQRSLPPGTPLWIGGAGASAISAATARVVRVTSWGELDALVSSGRRGFAGRASSKSGIR